MFHWLVSRFWSLQANRGEFDSLINSTISHFVTSVRPENPRVQAQLSTNENDVHRMVSPFKDQKSADTAKR